MRARDALIQHARALHRVRTYTVMGTSFLPLHTHTPPPRVPGGRKGGRGAHTMHARDADG